MMQSVHVRRATASDAEAILRGINEVCAERIYFSTPHYVPTPQWEAVLHRPEEVPNHLLFVVEMKNDLIGAAQILPCSGSSTLERRGELGIFVLAPFRDRGIGKTLLKTLLNAARHLYEIIELYVLSRNNRAIHLFRDLGFHEVARRYHRYAYLGLKEQVVMRNMLSANLGEWNQISLVSSQVQRHTALKCTALERLPEMQSGTPAFPVLTGASHLRKPNRYGEYSNG